MINNYANIMRYVLVVLWTGKQALSLLSGQRFPLSLATSRNFPDTFQNAHTEYGPRLPIILFLKFYEIFYEDYAALQAFIKLPPDKTSFDWAFQGLTSLEFNLRYQGL